MNIKGTSRGESHLLLSCSRHGEERLEAENTAKHHHKTQDSTETTPQRGRHGEDREDREEAQQEHETTQQESQKDTHVMCGREREQ